MKPARFLLPLSTFLLRLGVLFFIYVYYFGIVLELNYEQVDFYFAAVFTIFGVLFFIGTFLSKQTLTVLSSLILFLLSLYKIFTYSGNLASSSFLSFLLFGMVVFFFLCKGNRN
jgi:ABC-type bacteriocin/lantibiotic exporter with double-glycine peptidase domain